VGSHAPPPMGLPVLQVSPVCRHAVAITPVGPLGQIAHGTAYSTRFPVRQRRRPSPFMWRVGSHVNSFEACSAFTRVPAWRLAAPPGGTWVSKAPTVSLPPHELSGRGTRPDLILGRLFDPPTRCAAQIPQTPICAKRCGIRWFVSVVRGDWPVVPARRPLSADLCHWQRSELVAHGGRFALQ
jgi:hypothetical protein